MISSLIGLLQAAQKAATPKSYAWLTVVSIGTALSSTSRPTPERTEAMKYEGAKTREPNKEINQVQ